MHVKIILLLVLTISLTGISYIENVNATSAHDFELQWGKAGIAKPGYFLSPQHLAFDSENNVYVTDLGNSRVQKFDSTGNFLTEWGSRGSDSGEFGHPTGITVSNEFVFVVDNKNHNVQKFTLDGEFISKWGGFGNDNGFFKSPMGIVVSDDAFIYIVDSGNARIQKFTFDGQYVTSFGQSGKHDGGFIMPTDIAINSDKIYVTDPNQSKIIVFDLKGNFKKILDNSVGGYPVYPRGIVFDEENNFYVADYRNNRIIQYNEFGVSLSIFGQMGSSDSNFKFPIDVAISNDGYLYVTDSLGNRVQKFSTPISENYLIINEEDTIQTEIIAESVSSLEPVISIPNDFQKPKIMVPDDVLAEASGSLTSVNIGNAMATDESGILSLTNNAPSSFPIGTNTIIWTAIDGSGNMAIASQTVKIQDSTPPKISPIDDISFEAKSPTQNLVNLNIPNISDEVGVMSITNDAPEVFPLGETIVTWTATDIIGNVSTLSQSIVLIDSTAPRIAFSEDLTIEASSLDQNKIELNRPEAADQVEIASITNDAPEVFPLGETIVTWTATDSSGNSASTSQIITFIDSTIPKISTTNQTFEADNSDGSDISLEIPKIDDIQIASITNDAPEVFQIGTTIVTWTATDSSGNSASATQTITIIDTTSPVLILTQNLEIEAQNSLTEINDFGEIIAEDISGILSITNDAPEVFPLGETIVTWTATDNYNNSISNEQTITIIDMTLPLIAAPSNLITEANHMDGNIIDLTGIRASDQVEIASITNDAPEVFPLGETIVTWTATDSSGNSASATQTITIIDTTSPSVVLPSDIEVEITDKSGMEIEIGLATSEDVIDNSPTITNDAPEVFPLGETIVTWAATDSSGNSASATQTITIIDTTLPSIIPPVDQQIEATSMTNNIIEYGFAEASDQVEIASITNDAPEVFPLGETIVTWTATDSSGNSASATQTITIIDITSPVIETPIDIIASATSKSNNIVTLEQIFVSDSISDVKISNNAPLYYEFGETIVTWTATDSSGNSASATQTITIIDTTAPSITPPQNITTDAITLQSSLEIGLATSEDIIDNSPTITNDAPEVFPLGETIVTWAATDKFGNISYSNQIISVQVCGNSPSNYNMIVGSENDDLLIGTPVSDLIFGFGGDDIISGDKGNDCILAGNGNDIIFGNEGNDNISGEGGNDIIKGHSGDDLIFGGFGLDMLDGGEDIDTCQIIDEQHYDVVIRCELNE